jgi:acyl-CoA thioester hydrolase
VPRERGGRVTPFKFSTTFKVRFVETDLQGHVFFGNYLIYCDEALMEYLKVLNFGWDEMRAQGYDWVYAESRVQYKGSAKFEEILRTHIRIAHIGNSSVKAELQIFRDGTDDLIALAELAFVVVDKQSRAPTRVPDFFREEVEKYQS